MNQTQWPMGPQQFDFKEGSGAVEWKNWIRGFEVFAEASEISYRSMKNWLLHYAGPKIQSIYFNSPDMFDKNKQRRSGRKEYQRIVDKLTHHFAPKQNTSYERHTFRKMSQRKDERMDEFVMRLRIQADRCEFGRKIDENIKDQVTGGCNSDKLRRKILERNHKSLESVLKLCRVHEAVAIQEKSFGADTKESKSSEEIPEVCNIEDRKNNRQHHYAEHHKKVGSDRYECSRCASKGHKSDDDKCPAKGRKCERCGKIGHYARKCRSRIIGDSPNSDKRETVRMVVTTDDYDDYDDTF